VRHGRLDRLLDRLHVFRTRPLLAWPLLLGNLVAVWYGWTDYYRAQLEATAAYLWPFVPDSPNAVLSFALVLLLSQLHRRYRFLDVLAWALNIKVGLWTVFVLLYYFERFFADDRTLRWILFWLHVGMIGQAFVLHRRLRRSPPTRLQYGLLAGVLLVSDWVDYGPLDLHPYLRTYSGAHHDPIVAYVTVGLSLAVLAGAYLLYRPTRTPSDT
jgi:uncharacterized membrane protein YpjA